MTPLFWVCSAVAVCLAGGTILWLTLKLRDARRMLRAAEIVVESFATGPQTVKELPGDEEEGVENTFVPFDETARKNRTDIPNVSMDALLPEAKEDEQGIGLHWE